MSSKPRVIKDYEKLDLNVQEQIKLEYPRGYHRFLIKFTNAKGELVSALPFETEDRYYLVRMSIVEAKELIAMDDDYDDDGLLKDDVRDDLMEKQEELAELEETVPDLEDSFGDEEEDMDDDNDED